MIITIIIIIIMLNNVFKGKKQLWITATLPSSYKVPAPSFKPEIRLRAKYIYEWHANKPKTTTTQQQQQQQQPSSKRIHGPIRWA